VAHGRFQVNAAMRPSGRSVRRGQTLQMLLELSDVQYAGRVRPPLHGLGSDIEEELGVRQQGAEGCAGLAQIAVGLGFVRVGPEKEGQVLTRLGCVPAQHQKGQQRL